MSVDPMPLPLTAEMISAATHRYFEPHTDLFAQSDEPHEMFVIISGRVKFWRTTADGAAYTLLLLGPGEVVGALAVAQATRHPTSATALDRVHALSLPAELTRSTLRTDPAFSANLLRIVAQRAVKLIDRFEDSATITVEERLARLLLRLAGDFGTHNDDLAVVLDVRQQELAEMAFTTVPTVSRIISNWRKAKLLETRRGRIIIPRLSIVAATARLHLD